MGECFASCCGGCASCDPGVRLARYGRRWTLAESLYLSCARALALAPTSLVQIGRNRDIVAQKASKGFF